MNYFHLKSHKCLKQSLVIEIRSVETVSVFRNVLFNPFQVKSISFLLLFLFLILIRQYESTLIVRTFQVVISPFCFENMDDQLAFSMFPPPPNPYKHVGFAHFEMHTSPTHTLIMCRNKDAHTP